MKGALVLLRRFASAGPWLSVAVAGVVFALLFAGTPAAWADDMPTYQLVIKAGRLYPQTLEVPANTKFRLHVTNEGPGPAEFESVELRKEKVLAPGVSSNVIFQPLKPGTYSIFDEFHLDTGQGKIVAR